ncbi:winged helix-turn-helix transcriptional regulator [Bacillus sp. FJAT-49705]|uniref:Winged helix-turn-helix transcriptional regulator n=2 Tax=Cytobacillus citreus TaxID=2833586 RepID=A0ABS5NYZ5_9BACI|nr:winged helix-turn-helix transcriptional regulator [Cytobacillus citreus]
MGINLEQQKLISSPLRVKIIYLLDERPMTAKQVADKIGKSAGSIHYHIQQLYNGGILEIEETRENKGIIEKYYRAIATHFRLVDANAHEQEKRNRARGSSLSLSEEELRAFEADFDALLIKYAKKTVIDDHVRTPYRILCQFEKLMDEEDN